MRKPCLKKANIFKNIIIFFIIHIYVYIMYNIRVNNTKESVILIESKEVLEDFIIINTDLIVTF